MQKFGHADIKIFTTSLRRLTLTVAKFLAQLCIAGWHEIFAYSCFTVTEQVDLPWSTRSQEQTTIAMVDKSGKRKRLTLQEKLEA